ncbi:hypothetical protein DB88DRAFT_541119 [Papiliotrema laurentii]|uniref:HSF-type DNA-binding domain-containing protein n=1 Tax=Papiliotrema laurentii TaxID=5418 RepID=A0AAD9D179_PAPLA|nr:hypothetical protein DB88DRAFT_541119 [Papiliotrema laurentii]
MPAVDYAGLSTIPNATHMSSAFYPACISPQVFQHGRATFIPLTPHDEDFGDLLPVLPFGDATEFNPDDDEKTGEQERRTPDAATDNLAQGIQSSELHDGEATYLAYNLQQKDLPTPGGSDVFNPNDEGWIDELRAARKKSVPGRRQSLKKSYAKVFPPSTNIGTFNHVQKFLHIIASGLYSDLIFWSKRGNELVVPDAHRFAKQVLPKYYSTQTLESFVRQCTTYKMERLKFRSTEGTEGYVFSIPGVTEDSRALLGAYRRVPVLPSVSLFSSLQLRALR